MLCTGPLTISETDGWVSFNPEDLVGSGTWLELYIHERHEDDSINANQVLVIAELELLG